MAEKELLERIEMTVYINRLADTLARDIMHAMRQAQPELPEHYFRSYDFSPDKPDLRKVLHSDPNNILVINNSWNKKYPAVLQVQFDERSNPHVERRIVLSSAPRGDPLSWILRKTCSSPILGHDLKLSIGGVDCTETHGPFFSIPSLSKFRKEISWYVNAAADDPTYVETLRRIEAIPKALDLAVEESRATNRMSDTFVW